ncbi:MAG: NADH-quinone oxidoreductase subunit I [Deltaproteobacteria bacterium]|jgi:NADH-quinone oxidoreductase subunit I|nr:MAG: NADH-quinone oxidoreductase subunit I [Deltaproteobacteria bacterium]
MTIGVIKVARPREMSFPESLYLLEIVKGLGVTMGHLLSNIVRQEGIKTIEYPEVRRPMPPRFRGKHRLMKRENGAPRCVACYCCSTACPAKCITIVAGESPDPAVEKYPVRFDIDMLRCVFCGMCVEACPCDAIRMDTGWFTPPDDTREKLIFTIDTLLEK